MLIPNKVIGDVGKGKKYCTPEKALTLEIKALDLERVYKELAPFIE